MKQNESKQKCLFNKRKLINICNNKSSDEGDTSSDSTSTSSENELTNLNGDEEGICCQPVPLVPPPSPVSTSKNRLNKRVKHYQYNTVFVVHSRS